MDALDPDESPAAPSDDEVEEGADDVIAPPVVAVVVAHDPGPWFEESLRSLGEQDYPAVSVLVIDAGSAEPVTARVAAALPSAFVRRIEGNPGFGPAANEVLRIVEGAAFLLLCHDDVALDPNAVGALVEEAYRSNAGIVGPKLVRWDDRTKLLQVGMTVDKSGHEVTTVERGELDQEQHDAVRDVFAVPGGATLVRADLFATLGGYDPAIDYVGEDLDLCWRAQVAGARVIVAPAAVARHVEALGERDGFDAATRRRLLLRHRRRTMLVCYGRLHRWRVLPQVAFLAVVEVVYATLAGHRRLAADVVDAWRWNRAHRKDIAEAQARLEAIRVVPDREVRRFQARGSARFAAFLRGQIGRGGDDRVRSFSRSAGDLAGSLRRGPLRTTVTVWTAIVLVVLVGSRHFVGGGSGPSLLDLPELPVRPWPVLAEWLSGWRSVGFGSEAPQPTAFGILGLAGLVLLGRMWLLRTLLVVAPLLLGPIGAARLLRPSGSRRGALVAAVVYAAIPLPYHALGAGRWGGMLVWSAMPWVLAAVARAGGDIPFDTARLPRWRATLGLGLLTALLAAAVPLAVALPPLVAVGLGLGGAIAGRATGNFRSLSTALGASLVAVVLHLPWTLDFLVPGSAWAPVGGARSGLPAPTVADLLRFGTNPLGWAFLAAAAVPLLFGQGWRLAWAIRGWTLAVVGWAGALVAGATWMPVQLGPPELLLALPALGLSMSAALGVVSFEEDLRGYRFGWRQIASIVGGVAVVAGTLPALGAALGGSWDAPSEGVGGVLSFFDSEQAEVGPFRVLWVGDSALLPLGSWTLEPPEGVDDGDVSWALTSDGLPTVLDRWAGTPDGTTELAADAVRTARTGETSRLGRLLGPMGVRYVVVLSSDRTTGDPVMPPPKGLVDTFAGQLDMAEIEIGDNIQVFRNEAWFPSRATLPSADVAAAPQGYFAAAATEGLDGTPAVLPDEPDRDVYKGPVDQGAPVWFASQSSPNWELDVDGRTAARSEGFGWGNLFAVGDAGTGTLRYHTPVYRWLLSGAQAALWFAVAWVLWRGRARGAAPAKGGAA